MNPLQALHEHGQSFWIDFISRNLIVSGELQRLIDQDGLRGMTSNPTIFQKSISSGKEYDQEIQEILRSQPDISASELYEKIAIKDIRMAADILRPIFDESKGADGFVSLEPPAELAYDTEATMEEVRRLWQMVDRPNVMIKVPGTPAGIPVIEELIAEGVNINVTLMFSMDHYEAVSQAYLRGIARNPSPGKVASVASVFVSRIDTAVDKELERIGSPEALALLGSTAIANSKLIYRRFEELFHDGAFDKHKKRGAKVQRVLWGSTSAKNPKYPDTMYVDNLIGPDTINTMPPETITAFRDHGKARTSVMEYTGESQRIFRELQNIGVDLKGITEQLQRDGVKSFGDSMDKLLLELETKLNALAPSARR